MSYCNFIRTGEMVECKWKCGTRFKLPAAIDERTILHPCVKVPDFKACRHLGTAIGPPVKVSCATGCNKIHQPFECAIHGRCLPTFRGPWDENHATEARLYIPCGSGCNDFAARSNDADATNGVKSTPTVQPENHNP